MEFLITNPESARTRAFTLPELIISVLLGTVLLIGLMTFYGFSLSSFSSMTNYADLNNQSRNASDMLSRDIRAATSVSGATSKSLVLHAPDGTNVSYFYDQTAPGTLTRYKGNDARTVLKGISSLTFALYQRPTNSLVKYEQFPASTASTAKLISFQWTCSRRVAGPVNDSETLETAMVQMRNE